MADDLETAIETAAAGPAKVQADGVAVEQQKLGDLVEADAYLASKRAARSATRGVIFTRLSPPGATG